jgi:hypothetical protein
MLVVAADGASRRVPAGAGRIRLQSTPRRFRPARWREHGLEQSAQVSARDLSAHFRGCIVQYA